MIDDDLVQKHVDCLVDILHEEIKLDRLTVLVGCNGTGKSVVRKQMSHIVGRLFSDNKNHVRSISMQLRTESQPNFGALSSAMHDSPFEPIGLTSIDVLNRLVKVMDKEHYYVIDEAEIGMSEEAVYGLTNYFLSNINSWVDNTRGI